MITEEYEQVSEQDYLRCNHILFLVFSLTITHILFVLFREHTSTSILRDGNSGKKKALYLSISTWKIKI